MNRKDTGIVLTDRHGTPFFTFYSARSRTYVPFEKIPKDVRNAVIAAEDKAFYSHPGFSLEGIARALIENIQNKEVVAGGSTITQQLVKNALLTPKRDLLRKFQEVILAQEIERRYSKNEILGMYLNSVYFGNGAFGIEDAAKQYFDKDVSQLTLAESSMLAGILPAPTALSPIYGNSDAAKVRQKYVLDNMLEMGTITSQDHDQALQQKLVYSQSTDNLNSVAPHFAVMVRDQLIKKYGEEKIIRSGYKVKTSLDLSLQKFAEDTVKKEVEKLTPNNVSNGAAVVIDPSTGEILAMVGSKDWFDKDFGKVNVALQTRQPGSSFKPIVYALAMEEGKITPATVLHDVPTTFGKDYKPLDYDKKFRGNVLARRALANSLNIPAVEVMEKLDLEEVLSFAKSMGITTLKSPENYGPSLVLGTADVRLVDMTGVYATFANQGRHNDPSAILSITDKTQHTIYMYKPKNEQVVSPSVSYLISSILSDNQARAEEFGSTLTINRTAAVKTGTTENYRDAWTIGYTPQVAVGVWVGNNDGESMDQIAGSLGAAPIWKDLMEHYLNNKPEVAFQKPDGVVAAAICSYNGLLVRGATTSAKTEYFLSGTEPTRYCYTQPPVAKANESKPGEEKNMTDAEKQIEQANAQEKEQAEAFKAEMKRIQDEMKERIKKENK